MSYTEICNQPWMYLFVAFVLLCLVVQNIVMMWKAWKHARQDLGFTNRQIREGLVNGVLVSIVPTIPVIVVLLTMIPLLGAPLPWLRLSVIGSPMFESLAANTGLQAVGETLTIGGYTTVGWTAACWCMSIGGSVAVVWSLIATKPIEKLFSSAEKFNLKLALVLGSGCMMGVMSYTAISFGLGDLTGKFKIWLPCFIFGAFLVFLAKKFPKQKWINDYHMTICMLAGMVLAGFIMQ